MSSILGRRPWNCALPSLLFLFALGLFDSDTSLQASEKQSLFNGKNLQGWEGDDKIWSVQDGQIVGSTVDQKIQANTFLIWKDGEVENFRLVFKARVDGENNSGVQYRSKRKEPKTWGVVGYQMDIHSKPEYTAMLYGEGTGRDIIAERGEKATLETMSEQSTIEAKAFPVTPIDISKWHEYSIVAQGSRLIHLIDGETAMDITDNHEKKCDRGIIALQVHQGAPMTVYFKDIVLERLPPETR